MTYRNKTYICFDADTDMKYYTLMCAWKENEDIAFNFQNAHDLNNLRPTSSEDTIKQKLRERLANTFEMIVLIGEHTKYLYKFVRWEIEYAIEKDIPIICVNINKLKKMDESLCPQILKTALAIHLPYGQKIIDYALNNWPQLHVGYRHDNKSGPFHYKEETYNSLDL
ncbi:MAG: molecular chaperone Tir [Anaerolinea sp.]|nr:molecular chaperone Tir [Anaerolinea sp.]